MNKHYIENLPIEWESIAQIFSALGDKYRQTIILLFEPNEIISLKDIVDSIPLSRSAVVHHISTLQDAGLLTPIKRGREVYYQTNIALFYQAVEIVQEYMNPVLVSEQIGRTKK